MFSKRVLSPQAAGWVVEHGMGLRPKEACMATYLQKNLAHAGEIVVWGVAPKAQVMTVPPGKDFDQIASGGASASLRGVSDLCESRCSV